MKLLLDIGNSRLKWGIADDEGRLRETGAATHRGGPLADALALTMATSSQPREIRIANVAGPDVRRVIASELAARFGVPLLFAATPASAGGLRAGYADHRQLGVDRWLAMAAAWERTRGAACVVDAGTAATIDAIRGDGQHVGGVIAPGVMLMRSALQHNTGDLRQLAAQHDGDLAALSAGTWYAHDTATAMRRGAMLALASLVDRCVQNFRETEPGARLLMTGGDAGDLLPLLHCKGEVMPALVLEGLALEPARFEIA
jgi:type III pantothenate kinase